MSEWKKVKLGEICEITAGGDKPQVVSNYRTKDCTIPIYSNGIDNEGLYGFTNKAKNSGNAITITGRGANVGTVFFRKEPFLPIIRLLTLNPDANFIDARYLYYLLKGKTFLSTGSAQPQITVPNIEQYEIEYNPDITTQLRIASILSRYDTLIENYQKQIKLLEEAAQRLYKEWFVELRFPGHENTKMVDGLPEGWERKKLGELVTKSIGGGWGKESPQEEYDKEGFVIRGTDISKLRCGNLDDIPFRYHTESNLKERTLSDGDLIFEVSGGSEKEPVGRMYLITQQILDFYKKDVICASFCKKVAFSNKCTSILCYFAMQYCRISGDMKKYEKDSAGNIINFAWTTFIEDFFVLLPNDEILEAFYKTAIDIINKQVNLALQIRLLTEARDRLLPRLMGGEMEV